MADQEVNARRMVYCSADRDRRLLLRLHQHYFQRLPCGQRYRGGEGGYTLFQHNQWHSV